MNGHRYLRFGEFFDGTLGASLGIPFLFDIASGDYGKLWPEYDYESWSAEVEVFHSPMAEQPMSIELMLEAIHWREINGRFERKPFLSYPFFDPGS